MQLKTYIMLYSIYHLFSLLLLFLKMSNYAYIQLFRTMFIQRVIHFLLAQLLSLLETVPNLTTRLFGYASCRRTYRISMGRVRIRLVSSECVCFHFNTRTLTMVLKLQAVKWCCKLHWWESWRLVWMSVGTFYHPRMWHALWHVIALVQHCDWFCVLPKVMSRK